jgi:hypothetical protein
MARPDFKILENSASIFAGPKKVEIELNDGAPMLRLTNEYGNSLVYAISTETFDRLHAELWRFVKESQH